MKVLIIARGLPSEKYPLNGVFEFDQAKALKAQGLEITYFAIDCRSIFKWRRFGIWNEIVDGMPINIFSFPIGAVNLKLRCFLKKIMFTVLFNHTYKSIDKPDIIHAHFFDNGYIATSIAERHNIPLVITEHSSLLNKHILDNNIRYICEKAYNQASIISVSKALHDNIYNNFNIESTVIPNLVDDSVFSNCHKTPHSSYNFVTVANLKPSKRIDLLLYAFEKVYEFNHNCTLTIIGDGPERNRLEQIASNLLCTDKIKFLGRLNREQIAVIYSQMDSFVLPSDSETFGVSYIEAMFAGMPVIASRCGGPEDFINDEVGVIVDKNDLESLVAAMLNQSLFKRYSSSSIKNYAIGRFSSSVVAKELIDFFKEICD